MTEPIGATGNGATFFNDDERPRSAGNGTSPFRSARPDPTARSGVLLG